MEFRSIPTAQVSDGQVSLTIRRTQKAIEKQVKREMVSIDGNTNIVDDITQAYSLYNKLAKDEDIYNFSLYLDEVWMTRYPEIDIQDVVYAMYIGLQKFGGLAWIGQIADGYVRGYLDTQETPPTLSVPLPLSLEGLDRDTKNTMLINYISSVADTKAREYRETLNLLNTQLGGMKSEISLFQRLPRLKVVYDEEAEQESYFRGLYAGLEINESVAEYMYHNVTLDLHMRAIVLRKGPNTWTRMINDEVDEYIETYKNPAEDALTIYLYNGSPSLNAKVIINYKIQTISYKNKKTFNKQVIRAMLQSIGLLLEPLTTGGKRIFYYAYTGIPYANFSTVFGTMAVSSPTLSQVLAPRDLESYSNDTIKKKGFATNQNRTAFRFMHKENQMVNITLKYGNPRDFGTNVANATSDYLDTLNVNVYGVPTMQQRATIVALKFDRSTSNIVIRDIESAMNEFISYVLENGRGYQYILATMMAPDIDYQQGVGKDKAIQDLNRALPTMFDKHYTKFCSGPRLPTYVPPGDVGTVPSIPVQSANGEVNHFMCRDPSYPVLEIRPNTMANKVLHPFIPCCSPAPGAYRSGTRRGWDKTLAYGQIGDLPKQIESILSDKLGYTNEKLMRYGVGGPRSNAIRNAVRLAVSRYLEEQTNFDSSTRAYDDRFDDLLFSVENKYEVNIYILNPNGNFILPKYKKMPSFNPKIRQCVILYFLERSVDAESSYDIIAPFPNDQNEPSEFLYDARRNNIMYDLLLKSNTVMVAADGLIYVSPFDRIGLADVFPGISGVYLDSANKIRGLLINVGNVSITIETPPFANARLDRVLSTMYVSPVDAVISLFGQPKSKKAIFRYHNGVIENYVVYLYDYMGFPNAIKAVVSEPSTDRAIPWYSVLTIPFGDTDSFVLRHMRAQNDATILLKLLYWIWYPSILSETTIEVFLQNVLEVAQSSMRYDFSAIDFILPSLIYGSSASRLEYVMARIDNGYPRIRVSAYLYRNIYFVFDFVMRTRVRSDTYVGLRDFVVMNERYEIPKPTDKYIEFRSEEEIAVYRTYSSANSNSPLVAMSTEVLYNSKPPLYYFDGKDMMKVGYDYPNTIEIYSKTEDRSKTVSIEKIASVAN